MIALVTGAAGLIGGHIVRVLLAGGHDVRCLVRPTSQRSALAKLPVQWFAADVTQPTNELDTACRGCDVVFHTAAHFAYTGFTAEDLHHTAIAGTDAVLRSCSHQGVKRVVVTSSSVVFGYSEHGTVIDETGRASDGASEPGYVTAKIAQHRYSLRLAAHLRLDVRLACPTITIGPTDARLGPSNGAIVAYLSDPFSSTYPGGCNLVAAHDVAAGHLAIAESGSAGESYLLGSGNMTWQQLHGMIAELAGVPPPRILLNHTAAYLAATGEEIRAALSGRAALASREQAIMLGRYYWYSHRKAAELSYAPSPVRDAMVQTLSWLASSSHISREIRARLRLSPEIYQFRAKPETAF
jgi:dihydroflavonol-4-reductase